MKNLNKFKFTFALFVAMLFGAANMQAQTYDIKICGVQVTEGNKDNLGNIPGVTGTVKYNPTTKILTLNNASMDTEGEKACIYTTMSELIIDVTGTNNLSGNGWAPISYDGTNASELTIQGSGTLNVYNAKTSDQGIYMRNGSLLIIKDINLIIKSGKYAIYNAATTAENNVTIENANVTLSFTDDGQKDALLRGFKSMTLTGSAFAQPIDAVYNTNSRAICNAVSGNIIKTETKILKGELYSATICGVQLNSHNVNRIKDIPGVGAMGTVTYNKNTNNLRLEGASINTTNTQAVMIWNTGKIEVIGTNTLVSSGDNAPALQIGNKDIEVYGGGTLNVKKDGNETAIYVRKGKLTVRNCRLSAIGNKYGIAGAGTSDPSIFEGDLVIEDALVTARGIGNGSICKLSSITLNSCNVFEPSGAGISNGTSGWAVRIGSDDPFKDTVKIAAVYDLKVCGTQVNFFNKDNLRVISGVTAGTANYNSISKTLTLDNATISISGNTNGIQSKIEGLKINVSNTNTITSDGYAALDFAGKSGTIEGNGVLKVTNMADDYAIYVNGNGTTLTIKDCSVEAKSGKSGIRGANKTEILKLVNATVTAEGNGVGSINNFNSINFEGCFISKPMDGKVVNGSVTNASGAVAKDEVKILPGELYNLKICGIPVTSINKGNIKADVPNITSGTVTYNSDSKILTLNDATMSVSGSTACILSRINGLKIEVIGTNNLTGDDWSPISIEDDNSCTIQGSGTLNVTNSAVNDGGGIFLRNGDLTISTCSVKVITGGAGIVGNTGEKTLTISNANISTTGSFDGSIKGFKNLTLNNCVISQPHGAMFNATNKAVCYNNTGEIIKEEVRIVPGTTYNLKIYGVPVTSVNKDDLTVIPGVEGIVTYNSDNNILKLENATLNITGNVNGIGSSVEGLKIELTGENKVNANGHSGVQFNGKSATILGGGTLTVNNEAEDFAINATPGATLTISNCTVNATGGSRGINGGGNNNLVIENATVTAKGTKAGSIMNFADVTLNGVVISEPFDAVFNPSKKAICNAMSGNIITEGVKIEPGTTYDLKICGVPVTSINKEKLYIINGVSEGSVKYNPENKTLTLNNAKISSESKFACIFSTTDEMKIDVVGTNNLSGIGYAPISIGGDNSCTIQGNGTLNIINTGDTVSSSSAGEGIYINNGSLTIKNSNLNITAKNYGIWGSSGNKILRFENSKVFVIGEDKGSVVGFKEINFTGCYIVEPKDVEFNATKKAICYKNSGDTVKEMVKIAPETETYYTVTYNTPENGTLTVKQNDVDVVNGTQVEENSELVITATPNLGYVLKSLTVNGNDFVSGNTHVVTSNVNIVATFVLDGETAQYTVTYNIPEHGTLSVTASGSPVASGSKVDKGAAIIITATPDAGYKLKTLTVNNENHENGTVYPVMSDVNIVAEFIEETAIEEAEAQSVAIYPNPVQDILYIETEETITAVNVYDVLGAIVAQNTGDVREINLSSLPTGIYMVRVEMGKDVSTIRIVKN